MTTISIITTMSDRELLGRIVGVVGDERHITADLLALVGECDARRLYLTPVVEAIVRVFKARVI